MSSLVAYFHYNSATHSVSVYSDGRGREGGVLPFGEGYGGISIEDFRAASEGKIVRGMDAGSSYILRPARRELPRVQLTIVS